MFWTWLKKFFKKSDGVIIQVSNLPIVTVQKETKNDSSNFDKQNTVIEQRTVMYAYSIKCQMLVEEAKKWLNVREKGKNKGREVEMFQRTVDGRAVGEPWCLGMAQYCVREVDKQFKVKYGIDPIPTNLFATEHCMTLWDKASDDAKYQLLLYPGLLMVWQHWKDKKPTMSGHIGIVVEVVDAKTVKTIEGNTGPGDNIISEGDGVYLKMRKLNENSSMVLKGFLKPWNDKDHTIVNDL